MNQGNLHEQQLIGSVQARLVHQNQKITECVAKTEKVQTTLAGLSQQLQTKMQTTSQTLEKN
jgi:hypothetical protein